MSRKLVPFFAALAVCAAATAGVIATTAHAQTGNAKPLLVALTSSAAPLGLETAAPPPEGGAPAPRMRPLRRGADARDGSMCRALYAREVGALAYQGAMLNLTRAQQPLFDRWQQVRLDIAHRRQGACESRIAERDAKDKTARPDPLAREQDMLKTRLADLAAERPALDALTTALTPAQKRDFQPRGAGLGGPGGMRGRRFARMEPPSGPMGGRMDGPMAGRGMAPPPGGPDAPDASPH